MQVTADFLDAHQYTRDSIRTYELVYGRDFVSPGGKETARALIARLALAPTERVLDVGCGLGGSAFLMASELGAEVDGIDLSRNMIAMASARSRELGLRSRVCLEHGDCLDLDRPATYDAIYSRDVFLHIHDKTRLFAVLWRLLRPHGRLLFTDYCCGPRPWSDELTEYVAQRRYCLHTVVEYAGILEQAGFRNVIAEDRTEQFIDILRREIEHIGNLSLDEAVRADLVSGWREKLERAVRGEQRWGLFPANR